MIFHFENCQKYLSDSFKPLNQVVQRAGIPLRAGHQVTKNTHLPSSPHQCHQLAERIWLSLTEIRTMLRHSLACAGTWAPLKTPDAQTLFRASLSRCTRTEGIQAADLCLQVPGPRQLQEPSKSRANASAQGQGSADNFQSSWKKGAAKASLARVLPDSTPEPKADGQPGHRAEERADCYERGQIQAIGHGSRWENTVSNASPTWCLRPAGSHETV